MLKLFTAAQVNAGLTSVDAKAHADSNDLIRLSTGSPSATLATLNFNVDLRGDSVIFANSAFVDYAAAANIWDFRVFLGSSGRAWSSSTTARSGLPLLISGDGFGRYVVSLSVLTDSFIDLSFSGNSESSAFSRTGTINGVLSQAGATNDLERSFYWGGINYLEVAGQRVDFSVTSRSGLDYSRSFAPFVTAIPEPSTYALMLGGLAMVGSLCRRRYSGVSSQRLTL